MKYAATFTVICLCAGCVEEPPGDPKEEEATGFFSQDELKRILRASPLGMLPPDPTNAVADDPAAAHLGQYLFFDPRLSSNGEVACATCHDPQKNFADDQKISEAIGLPGRHTPSIVNNAHNRWFFWDGRADTLWSQALKPLESPVEHGGSRVQYAHTIYDDLLLKSAYENVFGNLPQLNDAERFPNEGRPVADDPTHPHDEAWSSMSAGDQYLVNVVFSNIGKAIAAYERHIISANAPFDTFVEGLKENDPEKENAISSSAKNGLKIFMGEGNCHLCHLGPHFSNFEFHNIGLEKRDWLDDDDKGRYNGVPQVKSDPFNAAGMYSDDRTGDAAQKMELLRNNEEQLGQFKVPSLRNVELSAPYMHGGHFDSLEDLVKFYSELKEDPTHGHREDLMDPLFLSDEEIDDVVEFLKTLTGEAIDDSLLVQPENPLYSSD